MSWLNSSLLVHGMIEFGVGVGTVWTSGKFAAYVPPSQVMIAFALLTTAASVYSLVVGVPVPVYDNRLTALEQRLSCGVSRVSHSE